MDDLIQAEVLAESGREGMAAAAMRRLGFQVLHIGPTISVSGPPEAWQRVFGVSFRAAPPGPEGACVSAGERPTIPAELAGLVREVYFVQPPEFF
jgi:hypothetical protein